MPRSIRCFLALVVGLLVVSPPPAADARVEVNDPVFVQGLQWALDRIGAPDAWGRATGRGVTIAVVDSGVDLDHEDLRGKLVGSVSCIGSNGDSSRCTGSAQDDNGHGTHVAGIALATTDNGLGVAGVAPDAKLLAVRVLAHHCEVDGCTAEGSLSDASAGIRWAVDHGADVINLSLGSDGGTEPLTCSLCSAIDYAWSQGVIAVLAAGNDASNDERALPSGFADEPAVVVTATTRDDARASYSNSSTGTLRSARWPIAAPGGEGETNARDCGTNGTPKGILSSFWIAGQSNQYACMAGTSMAAPHVSGALAVLLSAGYDPQGAVDRLLATAKDLGQPGRDDAFGYGRVDLARAAGVTSTPSTTRPSAPTTAPRPSGSTAGRPAATSSLPPTTTLLAPRQSADAAAPVVSAPETSAAAPFQPARDDATPPGALVVVAILAIVASSLGTAATAWRLSRS